LKKQHAVAEFEEIQNQGNKKKEEKERNAIEKQDNDGERKIYFRI
jgi:hypothetical protein